MADSYADNINTLAAFAHPPWTDEEIALLEKATDKKAGKQNGCQAGTVRMKRAKPGIEPLTRRR